MHSVDGDIFCEHVPTAVVHQSACWCNQFFDDPVAANHRARATTWRGRVKLNNYQPAAETAEGQGDDERGGKEPQGAPTAHFAIAWPAAPWIYLTVRHVLLPTKGAVELVARTSTLPKPGERNGDRDIEPKRGGIFAKIASTPAVEYDHRHIARDKPEQNRRRSSRNQRIACATNLARHCHAHDQREAG